MKNVLLIIQILISLSVILLISIQTKGTGLGRTFGSTATLSFKRRGIEKLIFKLTFIFTALFLLISIIQIFL